MDTNEKQTTQDIEPTTETSTPIVVTLELTLDIVNALIEKLAKQPFVEVAQLINIIRSQAIQQLQENVQTESTEEKTESSND